jgi:hypothetical protein
MNQRGMMAGELTGRNTLDTTTTGETSNGGLGDALDVVTEDLAMALGTALAEALATFAAWGEMLAYDVGHVEEVLQRQRQRGG